MFSNRNESGNNNKGNNYKYSLDYDSQTEYTCDSSGCDDEGICRCGRYCSVEVNSGLVGADFFFQNCYEPTGDALDKVLGHWFCRKNFHKISWTWESSGGYYGEELDSIYPDSDGGFFNLSEGFEKMSHKEKIEFLLTQEYGSVLPQISKVQDWELKAVFLSDVVNSSNTKLNENVLETYKKFCEQHCRGDEAQKTFQETTKVLAPLTLKNGNKYQIMDGRHRITALSAEYPWEAYIGRKKHKGIFCPVYVWVICPREK